MPELIKVTIPEHKSGEVPEHEAVGAKLDALFKQHFLNGDVVIRCVGSRDHQGLSLEDLTKTVLETGTDKYDAQREGIGYHEFNQKGIKVDFYGEPVTITEDASIMPQAIWEMHHSALGDRGYAVHVDLVLVYDRAALDMVMNLYDYHPTSDGFVFKHPDQKPAALLGVIQVN